MRQRYNKDTGKWIPLEIEGEPAKETLPLEGTLYQRRHPDDAESVYWEQVLDTSKALMMPTFNAEGYTRQQGSSTTYFDAGARDEAYSPYRDYLDTYAMFMARMPGFDFRFGSGA